MNTLTKRFLQYRSQPKTPAAPPAAPKVYPHTGFLSQTETAAARMERLVEARAAGYHLTNDDFNWMLNHRSFSCTIKAKTNGRGKSLKMIDQESHRQAVRQIDCLFCQTKPVYGGIHS